MQAGGQNGLRGQPLEDYVLDRIKHFAVQFAQELVPGITQQQLDLAFSRALYAVSAQEASGQAQLQLRFSHNCRFLGCTSQDCTLCKNNPNKTCAPNDNFDEAYADNQILKAKCEAEVSVELVNQATGEVYSAPGVEVQLSVVDGDAYSESAADPLATIVELHTSDEGVPLLQCYGTNRAVHVGTVVLALQAGRAKLPDVFITDKNDTFHFNAGSTTGHFRLLALAMRRDELGNPVPVEGVGPAVSNSFVVKTQRALNDYRKSAYPHYKDELTRLRYIGAITATRLKDARTWLGKDVPLQCVDTVQSLKQLLEYVDTNRQVEDKLLALLNMRGRHRHKWDFLRSVLAEKVVYDDNNFRVWYAPGANSCGLLYATKQAQIQNMDKPAGVAQRVTRPDGSTVVQVMMLSDLHQHPQLMEWRRQAEAAWKQPGHPGWQVPQEEIDYVTSWPVAPTGRTPSLSSGLGGPPLSTAAMGGPAPMSTGTVDAELQQRLAQAAAAAAAATPSSASAAVSAALSPVPEDYAAAGAADNTDYSSIMQQQIPLRQLNPLHRQGGYIHPVSTAMPDVSAFGPSSMQQITTEQAGAVSALRVHSAPAMNAQAAAAAVAAAMLRTQSDAAAMHEQLIPQQLQQQQQQQPGQAAMAMGLARLQAHMQAQQAYAQAQAAQVSQAQANQLTQTQAAQTQFQPGPQDFPQAQPGSSMRTQSNAGSEITQQQQQQQASAVAAGLEEAAGSAFMMQHPMDAVEIALAREALLREELQRSSATSITSTANAAQRAQHMQGLMGLAGGAAAAQGPEDAAYSAAAADRDVRGSSSTAKRGRGLSELQAVADPDTQGVLFTTASRDRHKPVARSAVADVSGIARPITDFVSLTAEDVAALQSVCDTRPDDMVPVRDTAQAAEDDVLGGGLNLTSTFSNALKLGDTDSLEAALLNINKHEPGSRQLHIPMVSDSFNRRLEGIMAGLDSRELQLPQSSTLDALLDAPSFDLAAVAAATVAVKSEQQQNNNRPQQQAK